MCDEGGIQAGKLVQLFSKRLPTPYDHPATYAACSRNSEIPNQKEILD
jgi:hypothetical protein